MKTIEETLHRRRADLVKQQAEHRAMVHVCDGAIQEIDRTLAELAKLPPPPAPKTAGA